MKNQGLTGIIGAMEIEVSGILENMQVDSREEVSGIVFSRGVFCGQDVVVAKCGVGKVFAALAAQTMILRYGVTHLLNTGVAGGIASDLEIGDVVVADEVVQHDMDTSGLGDPVGMISGINKVFLPCSAVGTTRLLTAAKKANVRAVSGCIASGDQFLFDSTKKKAINQRFGALAGEMEGAAIGQVCYVNDIPFNILRSISDKADEESGVDFTTYLKQTAAVTQAILRNFFTDAN